MPPTMGRPFVVSSTVFKSLQALVLCISTIEKTTHPPRSPPPPFPLLLFPPPPPPPPRSPAILMFVWIYCLKGGVKKVVRLSKSLRRVVKMDANVTSPATVPKILQFMFNMKGQNLFLAVRPSVRSERILFGRWGPLALRMLDDVCESLSVWRCFRGM